MKAIVLAGGFGTRLRPLSCTRPKLLFPIGNKPLLDWTIEQLAESGTREVILAVNYMTEALVKHYKKSKLKPKIIFSKDSLVSRTHTAFLRPLGTGGPVKKAERLIGHERPFIVLNGDILTNINYAELVKEHESNKQATATIALFRVEEPSRYGVAELAQNNHIVRFVEKPPKGKAPSNLINAGIYILEPEVFDFIPKGRAVSIEREVFPKLARKGKLYGCSFEGLWIDIGEPEDYLRANSLWLDLEIKENQISKDTHIEDRDKIKAPSTIDNGATIEGDSEIGPHVSLGRHVTIGKRVHIEHSIVFSGTLISDFASIKGAIVGENAMIGSKVTIGNRCLIGDHVMIHDGITLTQDVTICPAKEVKENVTKPKCLM